MPLRIYMAFLCFAVLYFLAQKLPYCGSYYTETQRNMPCYQQSPPSGTHRPRSSPTCYQQCASITLLRAVDEVQWYRRTEDWGCREAIRVNRITVTAYGWLQLFKTHLRMGNFLSGVFWELPHSVTAECKVLFRRETGTEAFSAVSSFVRLKAVLRASKERMFCPLSQPLFSYIINNPQRFPQSQGRNVGKKNFFFSCVCMCVHVF